MEGGANGGEEEVELSMPTEQPESGLALGGVWDWSG